ncbi:hypothetical protein CBOVI_04925 [Corynebacterium bovis DSM 20582 = CIP 54.80]|uniref:Uncharacterized protein n=1 Tax=Corynebacterium bovis DSM 20582 = CIP 54.80 TaxID=927655 RepID=A0A8I0CQ24_9CORY|nr:hypothetical protein [Corynebacterium bovis DSM 20582 = CIP 54.80]WJY77513.1 hypothetical protein CBOVI_04925 [Corynebacterium bovis DSM 20582 = CIP 54.80]
MQSFREPGADMTSDGTDRRNNVAPFAVVPVDQ